MGRISDATGGNIQLGYLVPIVCFIVIFFFALRQKTEVPVSKEAIVLSH